jgi:hypothetical protein
MGEWSDYFEEFPEENQANYIAGRFDPAGADAQRKAEQATVLKVRKDQQQLDAEIAAIVQKHKPAK